MLFAPYNVAEMTDLQREGIVRFDRQALTVDRFPPASLVLVMPEIQIYDRIVTTMMTHQQRDMRCFRRLHELSR